MPISHSLRKFLTANGVDSSTAQKVASIIQRKAQQNTDVLQQEWSIVYESIQRVHFNNFDRMKLQRLLKKTPMQPTEKESDRLGFKMRPAGGKGIGTKVLKIPSPPPPQALKYKLQPVYVKSWSIGSTMDNTPLSPAMLRQLAYKVASS